MSPRIRQSVHFTGRIGLSSGGVQTTNIFQTEKRTSIRQSVHTVYTDHDQ